MSNIKILDRFGNEYDATSYKITTQNKSTQHAPYVKMINLTDYFIHGYDMNTITNNIENEPARYSYPLLRATQIIGQNAAAVPSIFIDRRTGDEIFNHPIIKLFYRPNPYMRLKELISLLAIQMILYGEVFIYKNRYDSKRNIISDIPVQLLPINPTSIQEHRNDMGMLDGWTYTPSNTEESGVESRTYPLDDFIHIKTPNIYNTYRGMSVLECLKDELATDANAIRFNRKFYENGAHLDKILIFSQSTTDEDIQRMIDQFKRKSVGVENSHGQVAVRTDELKIENLNESHKDMQMEESRKFVRDLVFNTLGIPKTISGYTEDVGSYAKAKEEKAIFWENTMKPILDPIEDGFNYFIWDYDPSIKNKFDWNKIDELQRKKFAHADIIQSYLNAGWTANEINEVLGLGFPRNEETGDIRYQPANLLAIDVDNDLESNKEKKQKSLNITQQENIEIRKAVPHIKKQNARRLYRNYQTTIEKKFQGRVRRFLNEQRKKVLSLFYNEEKSFQKMIQKQVKEAHKVIAELDAMINAENERLEVALRPLYGNAFVVGQKYAHAMLGKTRDTLLNQEVMGSRINLIKGINTSTFNRIKDKIYKGVTSGSTIDEIAKEIKGIYNFNSTESRSLLIARTETCNVMSEASRLEYKNFGVEKKQWITAHDSDVRDDCLNAEAQGPINIDDPFHHGLQAPGAPNCRCCLSPVLKNEEGKD